MFPLALGWKITLSFFLSLTSFSPSPLITLDTISYQQCHIIYISLGQKCLIKHGNSSVPNTDYKFNEAAYLWHQGHRENPSNSRSASWRQRSTKKKRKKKLTTVKQLMLLFLLCITTNDNFILTNARIFKQWRKDCCKHYILLFSLTTVHANIINLLSYTKRLHHCLPYFHYLSWLY